MSVRAADGMRDSANEAGGTDWLKAGDFGSMLEGTMSFRRSVLAVPTPSARATCVPKSHSDNRGAARQDGS